MACIPCLVLTFIMLMMIGMVKGRWLEVEPYSTTSMVSDGIDYDMSHHDNPSGYLRIGGSLTLDGETRCESVHGFMPCGDTMKEGVFLIIVYMILMIVGEDCMREGTQALLMLFRNKKYAESVYRVLLALPRIVLVVAAGLVSTESEAQNQVAFGVGMYAGSTLINLTLVWGFQIILRKDLLRGKGSLPEDSEHQQDQHLSSTKSCLSLIKHKLSFLNDTGVNIQKETTEVAKFMLLSMIPFVPLVLVAFVNSPIMILLALLVSGASFFLYIYNQTRDPLIANRSLAYLKQEELEERLRFHAKRLVDDDIIKEDGSPNFQELRRIFDEVDKKKDNRISQEELEDLIRNVFELQKDGISMEYAKATIMSHFDDDNNGEISWEEFKKGCKKWMEKWNIWENMKMVRTKKKGELAQMDQIMPKMLKQLADREEDGLVTPDRKADKQKIERLFSKYDEDHDDKLLRDELKKFIKEFRFGTSLDQNTIMDMLIADFSTTDGIAKHEFVEGFARWTEKFIDHDPNIKDPLHKLKTEKDIWVESPKNRLTPQAVLYVAFGIAVMYLISTAFTQSVLQFSNALHIPLHLTSLVVFPIAMNAKSVIIALLNVCSHVEKNASLTFNEIYGGLVMNNLFGLFALLIVVFKKRLSWTYWNEVLIIMIPCIIVGVFALKRDTYPLWAAILAILLYPIFICLYMYA